MFPKETKIQGVEILSVDKAMARRAHPCAWGDHMIPEGALHLRVSWKDRRNGADKLENDHICVDCWTKD
jgi:hypothetical protein